MRCDYIFNKNGEKFPIYSFYQYFYNSAFDEIEKVLGYYRSFKIGDKLDLNTDYYKYPEFCNFLITFNNIPYVIIVRDGKLKNVQLFKEDDDLMYVFRTYDEYGRELKISSSAEAKRYFDSKLNGDTDEFYLSKTEDKKEICLSVARDLYDRYLISNDEALRKLSMNLKDMANYI